MAQIRDLADDRLFRGCAYCGGAPTTRDHVPSRVLLDEPFPEDLPVVRACKGCNEGFSMDEEYVACLVECANVGHVDPGRHPREKVANILRKASTLRARLEAAQTSCDGKAAFVADPERVRRVLLKLAKGHAMFELSWYAEMDPVLFWWAPLHLLEDDRRHSFEQISQSVSFGEIGSRASQRVQILQLTLAGLNGEERMANFFLTDWVEVQEGRYRYLASDQDGQIRVRLVIGEYLACEVVWDGGQA